MSPVLYSVDPDAISINRCLNCGAKVSAQFARVFGDNENDIFGCIRCTASTDLLDWTT